MGNESVIGTASLKAAMSGAILAGMNVRLSRRYEGRCQWLALYGVGHTERNAWRHRHVAKGGFVACFDLGYLKQGKDPNESYMRVSVNHNHPYPRYMEATPNDNVRWNRLGIPIRDEASPDGPVIVVGLGPKSRVHLNIYDWEARKLADAKKRFPTRKIIYRPKPYGPYDSDKHVTWEPRDWLTPIDKLLKGASLVITRHSNVGIDAAIAGVPCETEDGAALYLYKKESNPSRNKRVDFLHRLAYWQYQLPEMADAWKFLMGVVK